MDDITAGLVALTIVLVLLVLWFSRTDARLPPCPVRPLPVLGHLLAVATDQRSQYKKWRQQCGDIFSLYMGSKVFVVINGYELMKEIFVKRGKHFSDRPVTIVDMVTGQSNAGVIISSGDLWKEQRSVTIQLLRSFGLGNNVLANIIQDEVSHYLHYLAEFDGQPMEIDMITKFDS